MSDAQIDYLVLLLTQVRVKVTWCPGGDTYHPVLSVALAHRARPDDPGDVPEPVAFLGGTAKGSHISLWNTDISEFTITPDVAKWPE